VPQICVVLLLGVLGALSWLVWNYHRTVVWVEHSVAVKSSTLAPRRIWSWSRVRNKGVLAHGRSGLSIRISAIGGEIWSRVGRLAVA